MISKQTKVLAFAGIICLASALIWQNYSHLAFELSAHRPVEEKTGSKGSGGWDPGSMWVHHPVGSDFLFLVGAFGLLLTVPSLIGDIKRSRQHR
jgi:hypothetical protein